MGASTTTDVPVRTALAPYAGKRLYFDPLVGNNGDRLIEMGSRALLQSLGINPVPSPRDADLIVMNGGGGMSPLWKRTFGILRRYNEEYSETPLIVLPSSYEFDAREFGSWFEARRSPATLYARERPSLRKLRDVQFPCPTVLGLDHDMAFMLRDTCYLQTLKRKAGNRHILIVERSDAEGVTGARPLAPMGPAVKRLLPAGLRNWARHMVWDQRARRGKDPTPFAQSALRRALEHHPEFRDLPTYTADISHPHICGFRRFGLLVARSAVVITTRLHVAILASMLDKPVHLTPGSFHKIAGVYDYSLLGCSRTYLT